MTSSRALLASSCAVVLLAFLTGCSGQSVKPGIVTLGAGDAPPSPSASILTTASAIDACAIAPAAELEAAIGSDPGAGVAEEGRIDGGQCTWKITDTRTALLQVTRSAKQYLPADIYPKPDDGVTIDGVDSGWASAEKRTIYLVKGDDGALFTDIAFGDGKHGDYTALAKAIAARL